MPQRSKRSKSTSESSAAGLADHLGQHVAAQPAARLLYLIDGHGQIFRSYYAIRGAMSSPVTGEPTNAVFAFAAMLLKFFLNYRPQYALMAIDSPGKTFREEIYPEYKAHRPPPPPDLPAQEQRIFDMTRMFGIPIFALPGAEADDIIATVVQRVLDDPALADVQIRIVSKDKDLEQLLGPRVSLFDIHTDTILDTHWLLKEKGLRPEQVIDALALMGDSVDNVPGVPGIGPKTAAQLISEFGTLDNLLANLDRIKGKRRENIEASRQILPLSRQLVELKRDLPIEFSLDKVRLGPPDAAGLRRLFDELGFRKHQPDLERLLRQTVDQPAQAPAPSQNSTAAPPQALDFPSSLFDTTAAPSAPSAAATSTPGVDLSSRDYRAVTTPEQLEELVAVLRQQKLIAVDTETIGLGHRARLCGISLAWQPGSAVYIPVAAPPGEQILDLETIRQKLNPVLSDPTIGKCGHNLKYDWLVLRYAGFNPQGIVFDSMIASHLLGAPGHGLDHLALALLGHRMMQIRDLLGGEGARTQRTMDQVPLALITPYACDDAEVALRLYPILDKRLELAGMTSLARDVEMPLIEVLADMEFQGIRVDPAKLRQQKEELAQRIQELRRLIFELVGEEFNLDSPRQLSHVLFEKMGLPVIKRKETGPSTDSEVLERLAELDEITRPQAQLLELISEYRQLSKLVSTYLDALEQSIHPATGRIHAQFHQTGTATGRLSSSDPNLQNIPIRTEVGRRVRSAFVAEPGWLLVCADYSQIELRVLAHLSNDPGLREAFQQDQDIHRAVAAQVFGVRPEDVTKPMRNYAKVINFGIVYGVTPFGLARRIEGLSVDAARQLISDYRRRFAGIGTFLDRCIQQAETVGYVTTILGRRRPIPQIRSTNPSQRSLGQRLAINSVVQGSAADLMKLAMVNLFRRLRREKYPARILLQIHDELVLETPQDRARETAEIVRYEMENAMALTVPLKVEVGIGPDWLTAKGEG